MSYIIKFVLFTKLNIMILLSEHSKIDSSSDMKKKKRIEKSRDFCDIFDFVNIQSLSNSEKTIFVCHFVKKHFITWMIHEKKSAVHIMCKSLLCNTLLNVSFRFKLNINITHSDFAFHTVLTHNVNSSKTVKVNLCFLIFI